MGHHKKNHKKKKKHYSSSEEEWVEKKIVKGSASDDYEVRSKHTNRSSSITSSSSEHEVTSKKSRSGHRKWKKKSTHQKSRLKHCSSTEDLILTSTEEDEKTLQKHRLNPIEGNKRVISVDEKINSKPCSAQTSKDSSAYPSVEDKFSKRNPESSDGYGQFEDSSQANKSRTRDEWMNLSTSFSCTSSSNRRTEREQQKKLEREKQQYNPRECSRELNPYWKNGGDGLPSFKKPKELDEDHESHESYKKGGRPSNWKKRKITEQDFPTEIPERKTEECTSSNSSHVTSQKELNSLAAKLVKAEIMGNAKLVAELKEKLEKARELMKEASTSSKDEHVILTHTDSQGRSQPLRLQAEYGESESSKKNKRKRVETHVGGERQRYFADDDKYSLKQMFENEKYSSVEDQNKEFLKMTSKLGKNDDLDDIFTDNIRNKESDSKLDSRNRDRAIHNHDSLNKSMDNCDKCIQSETMSKHLMISMGDTTYLSLPAHEPLSERHCVIVPIRHVPCSTQLDENEWSEILDLRKSITRLCKANNEEVIFFESAMKFHRYPHMFIECVSLPKEEGDMAPIYFKKAIDESEYEWSQNKKVISLKGRDVRKAVPKGLPYFSVSFGLEEGFAHVIEDERCFPPNFAQEIIGGMLDLHHSKWRKPKRQNFEEQSERVLKFSKEWNNIDCTS